MNSGLHLQWALHGVCFIWLFGAVNSCFESRTFMKMKPKYFSLLLLFITITLKLIRLNIDANEYNTSLLGRINEEYY